jgi:dTDP-4-dehydrorhamnose 3,5-epimerase-like enzyme
MIGAGAVVTRDVPPNAIVVGNPGKIKGYANTSTFPTPATVIKGDAQEPVIPLGIGSAQLYHLPEARDLRGSLTFAQHPNQLPFVPQRCFIVYDVPSKEVRGEHAHHMQHQFLICVSGSIAVVLYDGERSLEVRLDRPSLGLYIPPMIWATQYKYTPDAVLVVLASDVYDPGDYIRDYDTYTDLASKA